MLQISEALKVTQTQLDNVNMILVQTWETGNTHAGKACKLHAEWVRPVFNWSNKSFEDLIYASLTKWWIAELKKMSPCVHTVWLCCAVSVDSESAQSDLTVQTSSKPLHGNTVQASSAPQQCGRSQPSSQHVSSTGGSVINGLLALAFMPEMPVEVFFLQTN